MEVPYDSSILHTSRRAGKKNAGNSKRPLGSEDVSTLQTATQLFGSVASQAVRFPFDAVSTAAHIALHPGETLNAVFRNEENEKLARRTRLLQQLRDAPSWTEYSATCTELDNLEGAEVWKDAESSELYDVDCLRGRLNRLRSASNRDDVEEMVDLIRFELTRDLGGICNPALHQQTRTGTKFLVAHYITTVRQVLDRIVTSCASGDGRLNKHEVQEALDAARWSYGRTALLLSGGGTLGMAHIGVIKALHEAGALPRVISGSSSGSIVAAVLGATPDEDLHERLTDFCHGDLAVFVGMHEKQGWPSRVQHAGKNGHLFDLGNLRRVMVDLLGKTTFGEAYNQTRRVLNIAVSNASHYESHQVLNYATARNVVIWSAVVASCAVPFGFEPESLLHKLDNDHQDLVPWDPFTRYVDGSINGDLPTNILSAEFDVNHSIVSQVNPHVVPFLRPFAASNASSSTPYWLSAGELLKEEGMRAMEIISDLPSSLERQNLISKLNSILGQRYSGDITLLPIDVSARFWTILENPTPEFMEDSSQKGERATWPVLNMIKTHMDIELLIDNAVRKVSEYVSFGGSTSDLRRLHLRQARASNHASGGRLRSRRAARNRSRERRGDLRINIKPLERTSPLTLKIPGEPESPSSLSSAVSVSSISDDDMEAAAASIPKRATTDPDSVPETTTLTIQTQPNTPTLERMFVFARPPSPARPPMSLVMTPVTPRANSPDTSYKKPLHRARSSVRSATPVPRSSSGERLQQERSLQSAGAGDETPKRVRSATGINSTRTKKFLPSMRRKTGGS